jgi:hypothetical protein
VIYFRPHIRALEQQIAYLKERLEKAERENRELLESRGLVLASQSQAHIETLKSDVDDARLRANGLLDRVLMKNNVDPVIEKPKPAAPEILGPFATSDPEVQAVMKESWLKEETEYLMREMSCDEGTARAYAEQNYVSQFQVIK